MTTYEGVHSGDVVLGHDGELWGVESISHVPQLAVTLVKDEGRTRVTGYPPPGAEVTVVATADLGAEARVAQMFIDAGLGAELIAQRLG